LVVAGTPRADLLVGRVWGHAAGIADSGDINTVTQFPELALGAPEAAQSEHRLLGAVRVRPLQRVMIDEMRFGGADGAGAARQCLAGLGHGGLPEAKHAGSPAIAPSNICRARPG